MLRRIDKTIARIAPSFFDYPLDTKNRDTVCSLLADLPLNIIAVWVVAKPINTDEDKIEHWCVKIQAPPALITIHFSFSTSGKKGAFELTQTTDAAAEWFDFCHYFVNSKHGRTRKKWHIISSVTPSPLKSTAYLKFLDQKELLQLKEFVKRNMNNPNKTRLVPAININRKICDIPDFIAMWTYQDINDKMQKGYNPYTRNSQHFATDLFSFLVGKDYPKKLLDVINAMQYDNYKRKSEAINKEQKSDSLDVGLSNSSDLNNDDTKSKLIIFTQNNSCPPNNDEQINENNNDEQINENNNDALEICKTLIVLICIEEYCGDQKNKNKLENLLGARIDEKHMLQLFAGTYNYDIMRNKEKKCTLEDLKDILRMAQIQFSKNDYQCIMFIYSGHGERNTLILSDYYATIEYNMEIHYKYNSMDRTELECYFNGENVKNKADKLKIFFLDACRGNNNALPIKYESIAEEKYQQIEQRGVKNINNQSLLHPNENRIVFYPNTEPYASYGFKDKGGVLIHGLYQTMIDKENMNKNFVELQDIMRDKVEDQLVPVLDGNGKIEGEYNVRIEIKTTMKNRLMQKIYFKPNNSKKDTDKMKRKNELNNDDDINLLYL